MFYNTCKNTILSVMELPMKYIVGFFITFITLATHIEAGGRCSGEWASQHMCFANGKRSQVPVLNPENLPEILGPLSRALFGDLHKSYHDQQLSGDPTSIQTPKERAFDHVKVSRKSMTHDNELPVFAPPERELENWGPFDRKMEPSGWQRLRDRLVQEKAREVYQEMERIARQEDTVELE